MSKKYTYSVLIATVFLSVFFSFGFKTNTAFAAIPTLTSGGLISQFGGALVFSGTITSMGTATSVQGERCLQ